MLYLKIQTRVKKFGNSEHHLQQLDFFVNEIIRCLSQCKTLSWTVTVSQQPTPCDPFSHTYNGGIVSFLPKSEFLQPFLQFWFDITHNHVLSLNTVENSSVTKHMAEFKVCSIKLKMFRIQFTKNQWQMTTQCITLSLADWGKHHPASRSLLFFSISWGFPAKKNWLT